MIRHRLWTLGVLVRCRSTSSRQKWCVVWSHHTVEIRRSRDVNKTRTILQTQCLCVYIYIYIQCVICMYIYIYIDTYITICMYIYIYRHWFVSWHRLRYRMDILSLGTCSRDWSPRAGRGRMRSSTFSARCPVRKKPSWRGQANMESRTRHLPSTSQVRKE